MYSGWEQDLEIEGFVTTKEGKSQQITPQFSDNSEDSDNSKNSEDSEYSEDSEGSVGSEDSVLGEGSGGSGK